MITENYKVIFIGDANVGKTSIVRKYINNEFMSRMDSTIGASFACTHKIVGDRTIKLHIWDTAGQERFKSIISVYYRGADTVVAVCDVSNQESIYSLEYWIKDFKDRTDNTEARLILVVNKMDICLQSDKVHLLKLEELAEKYECPLISTSACSGENIERLFDNIFQHSNEPYKVAEPEVQLSKAKQIYNLLTHRCTIL